MKNKHYSKKHKCLDCSKIITNNSLRCIDCYNKNRKLAIITCIDCGKELSKNANYQETKRCRSCAAKFRLKNPENHPMYKDGDTLIQLKCKNCGKNLGILSKYLNTELCKSCSQKERFKDPRNHPSFIDGRTSLLKTIKRCKEYFNWRIECLKRDNYTCCECKQTNCYLEVHHIKSFKIIFNEFLNKYSNFSSIDDKYFLLKLAKRYEEFWDLNNGRTLCLPCHEKTDNYAKSFLGLKKS